MIENPQEHKSSSSTEEKAATAHLKSVFIGIDENCEPENIKETIQNALDSYLDTFARSNQLDETGSYAGELATFIKSIDLFPKQSLSDDQKDALSKYRDKLLGELKGLLEEVNNLSEGIRGQVDSITAT